ncbi:magnesium and cobalt transport protein CorA [Streptomyces sp. NPDC091272]|uniref:magnesium and cobalt transport protein CorA n=1 Tax=Streptomyces sp. NPDC091272 TaxID=3365981 RepID=UPI0037F62AF1
MPLKHLPQHLPLQRGMRRLRTAARRRMDSVRRTVDLSHPARSPLGSAVENCVVFERGVRRPRDCSAAEALERVRKDDGAAFVWIGLHEPDQAELDELAALFGLHPLAVHDASQGHRRPRLARYDDTLLAVFRTVRYVEHEELTATSEVVDTGELTVFAGPDFVITARHGGSGSLGPIREALEDVPEQLAMGPAAVLHAIADHVVDEYEAVADAVQVDVDAVETVVFSADSGRADPGRIYQLKRELLELRRAVAPLARPLQVLADPLRPTPPVVPGLQPYFRDVADHLDRTVEQIASFDNLLDSILQAHLAQVTVTQNEDMRKITAWAAIIAVPTMGCGVWGMNFDHMPELGWTYGYPLALAVMALACFTVHRSFRRNGWL